MTTSAVSGFIEQAGSLVKEIPNIIIIHQLPHNPSSFKELAEHLSATQGIPVHWLADKCLW